MSTAVDQFCDKLRDRLNAMEARFESFKAEMQSLADKESCDERMHLSSRCPESAPCPGAAAARAARCAARCEAGACIPAGLRTGFARHFGRASDSDAPGMRLAYARPGGKVVSTRSLLAD
jgi:hypothetical protein